MKKLMIAAAIVCAAAMSQATTYSWGWTVSGAAKNIFEGGSVDIVNTTVYLFSDYTTASAMGAAADGVIDTLRGNGGDITAYTFDAKHTAAIGSNGKTAKATDFGIDEFTGKNYMFALILAEGKDGSKWAAINDLAKTGLGTGSQPMNFDYSGFDGDYVYALDSGIEYSSEGAGWYQITEGGSPTPTPEPTSGLLLLLGVAGLALRRRRA